MVETVLQHPIDVSRCDCAWCEPGTLQQCAQGTCAVVAGVVWCYTCGDYSHTGVVCMRLVYLYVVYHQVSYAQKAVVLQRRLCTDTICHTIQLYTLG
jgi:hypothetical protein